MALEPIEIAGIMFGVFSGGTSLAILLVKTFFREKPKLEIEITRAAHFDQVYDSSRPEESKRTNFFVDLLVDNTGDRSTRITKLETTIAGKGFQHDVSQLIESPEGRVGAHDSTTVRANGDLGKKLEERELALRILVHHTHNKLEVKGVSKRV